MRRRRRKNKAPPLGLRVAGGDLCGIAAKATTEAGAEKAVFMRSAKTEGVGRFFVHRAQCAVTRGKDFQRQKIYREGRFFILKSNNSK